MNVLIEKVVSLFKRERYIEVAEKPISTAAFAVLGEPDQIHQDKRRLKESYTSHWDLDYLPSNKVEKIFADARVRKP